MAAPRVFISSTYYDLKQVRNNIGDFIKSLGYEAVMHERSKVAYTQSQPLEADCYHEILGCEIVICIIGNHFGSQSIENELSITMNELKEAIKNKKKIYIFIAKDVFVENRTYQQNKDNNFKSAYVDNLKIHEFIADLQASVKNHVITAFETTDDIIDTLKSQFAGLFQNLLARESTMTEAKTTYDLQEAADLIKAGIEDFSRCKDEFFSKFNSSFFMTNRVIYRIKQHLGLKNSAFFASSLEALDEIMDAFGFSIGESEVLDDIRFYYKEEGDILKTLTLKENLFNDDLTLKDIRLLSEIDNSVIYNEEVIASDINDGDIPF